MDLKKVCGLFAMLAILPVFSKDSVIWQNNPVVAMLRDGSSLGKSQEINSYFLSVTLPFLNIDMLYNFFIESIHYF